jgi:membrane protein implicated in regulation of membrane protease activity
MTAFSLQRAVVATIIHPHRTGRIKFQGSWWFARCDHNITLHPGETVQVIGRQNITLLVEPILAVSSK